ncbi:unnamed protein product [Paramecium sonneborni]|uniref:Uncharacterized protein n=1 Tax=Paramecium sonneborni TaxID=65129 RepID=A0A8S1KBH7_9CILI|nr:unnamed protein product [Paramecium sonneborni]
MGNNCLQSNQTINQKEKVIHIRCYPNLLGPNKQILHQSIKNLSQNLDTFEEDFYKNEFFFDFANDNNKNNQFDKNKQDLTILNEIQGNIIECPSFENSDESQSQYKTNLNSNQEDVLNFAFIKEKKKKKEIRSFKNSKKPVQEKLQLKSILKQNKSNRSSLCSYSDRNDKQSVSFNILPSNNNKNARSFSPIIYPTNILKSKIKTQSMIFMQQFPYK